MTNKVELTLDENKEVSMNSKNTDEVDVLYMLVVCLIHTCKDIEMDKELIIAVIKETWGNIE